jgi:hypothetical protein
VENGNISWIMISMPSIGYGSNSKTKHMGLRENVVWGSDTYGRILRPL